MSLLGIPETILWNRILPEAFNNALPDDGEIVLIYSQGSTNPVWLGYYVGDHVSTMTGKPTGTWYTVYGPDHRKLVVDAWAKLPTGRI